MHGIDDLQLALGALSAFTTGAIRGEVIERRTARFTSTDDLPQTVLG